MSDYIPPSIPDDPVTDLFNKLAGWFYDFFIDPLIQIILGLWNGIMAYYDLVFIMLVIIIISYPFLSSNLRSDSGGKL